MSNSARVVGAGTLGDPTTYPQLNTDTRLTLALTPFSGETYIQVRAATMGFSHCVCCLSQGSRGPWQPCGSGSSSGESCMVVLGAGHARLPTQGHHCCAPCRHRRSARGGPSTSGMLVMFYPAAVVATRSSCIAGRLSRKSEAQSCAGCLLLGSLTSQEGFRISRLHHYTHCGSDCSAHQPGCAHRRGHRSARGAVRGWRL